MRFDASQKIWNLVAYRALIRSLRVAAATLIPFRSLLS